MSGSRGLPVNAKDKTIGELVWQIPAMDGEGVPEDGLLPPRHGDAPAAYQAGFGRQGGGGMSLGPCTYVTLSMTQAENPRSTPAASG